MTLPVHLLHGQGWILAAQLSGSQARLLFRLARNFFLFRLLVRWLGPTAGWVAIAALTAGVYTLAGRRRGGGSGGMRR